MAIDASIPLQAKTFSLADLLNDQQGRDARAQAMQIQQQQATQQQVEFARQQRQWQTADSNEANQRLAVAQASKGDYTGADSQYGAGAGSLDIHKTIAGLQDEHRAQARAQYAAAIPVAIGALGVPAEARGAFIQSHTADLVGAGWKPEEVAAAASNPSDENLKLIIDKARSAEDALKLYDARNKPAEPFTLGQDQVRYDAQGHEVARGPESIKSITTPEGGTTTVFGGAGHTGIGGDINSKILALEGTARNPKSSANGPGQFVNSTFRSTVGLVSPQVAQQIAGMSDQQLTQWRAANAQTLAPIQTQMTAALTQQNQQALTSAGIQPTEGNTYMAHVFGAGGTASMLRAGANAPAAQFIGATALTNNRIPANATVGQVQQWATQKMAGVAGGGSPLTIKGTPKPVNDTPDSLLSKGYRMKLDGTMEPIPGGPADPGTVDMPAPREMAKRNAAYPKVTQAYRTSTQKIDQQIRDIQTLQKMPGLSRIVGMFDANTPNISGPARAAQALYDKIMARGQFNELQDMRNSSPTGGALGAVSDSENKTLRDAAAALNRNQDEGDFGARLDDYLSALQNSRGNLDEAYNDTYSYRQGSQKPAATSGWSVKRVQ